MRQPSPFPTRGKGPGDKVLSGRLKGLEARGAVQTGAAGVSESQFDVISIIMPEPLSQAATHDAAREREEPSATDAPHEANPSGSLIMDKLATSDGLAAAREVAECGQRGHLYGNHPRADKWLWFVEAHRQAKA